jgi:hypothetical protein
MSPKAFLLSNGSDTGGVLIRTVEAFAKEGHHRRTPWEVRSMVTTTNYIEYPQDIPYSDKALFKAYDEADVALHNSSLYGWRAYDQGQAKPSILLHHGVHLDHFERSTQDIVDEAADIGLVQAGTTVNLELLGPPGLVTWLPTAYDLVQLAALRAYAYKPNPTGAITVMHCPTDRAVKSTEAFLDAIKTLQGEGHQVIGLLIEGMTNRHVIATKAKLADIYVDQLKLGYG